MLLQKLVFVAQLGASVVLYLLIGLSILSIGLIFERWWFFRRRRLDMVATTDALEASLRQGNVDEAAATLKKSKSIEAEVIGEALQWYASGADAVEQILAKAVRQRRKAFEGGLLFLGTLGNNAPFIGLFGTVLGIVTAFRELGSTQAGASAGMGNVMGGIAEALVATAIGILVALPAVIAYNVFQKKAVDVEDNAATLGNVVLASLAAQAFSGHAAPARLKPAARAEHEVMDEDVVDGRRVSAEVEA
ncbi:MAG TPA: MotA/TolQ/ExbB proton channel family protein [Polyangia bacterium]|jgi:biopolymer transport protein ExbB/biopolymer transport protein TolQ